MSDFTERYLSIAEDCGFDHASPLDVSTLQVATTGPVPRPAARSKSVKRRCRSTNTASSSR